MTHFKEFDLRPIRCIYLLYRGADLVYIGKTGNLHSRTIAHMRKKRGKFDRLFYIEIPKHISLDHIELHLIRQFDPPLNRTGPWIKAERRADKKRHNDAIINRYKEAFARAARA